MAPSPAVMQFMTKRRAANMLALASLSGTNFFVTPSGGGEPGVATGFGSLLLFRLKALSAASPQTLAGRENTAGWWHYLLSTNLLYFYATTGVPGTVNTPGVALVPSDVGRVIAVIGQHTGPSNTIRQLLHGRGGPDVSAACAGFTAQAIGHAMGAHPAGNNPATNIEPVGHLTWQGVPSDAQLYALFDAARSKGDVPTPTEWPYGTNHHRWSVRDAHAGLTVVDGQTAPATLADTVTGLSANAMARQGSPTVRVIDASVDGRKSVGLKGASGTSYLQATSGIKGAPTGLTVLIALRVEAVPSGSTYLVGTYTTAPAGYAAYGGSNGVINVFRAGSGDLQIGTCGTGDIGQIKLVGFTWDGTTWRAYENGVAGATSAAGLTHVGSAAMQIGRSPHDAGVASDFATLYGVLGCDIALSAAEVAAVYADWRSTGVLRLPAGKTNPHEYDFPRDMASDTNSVPATFLDRAGTDHLARKGTMEVNGTGLRMFFSQYAQSVSVAAGLPGSVAGWYVECVARLVASSSNQSLFSNTGGGANGLNLYVTGGSTILRAQWGDGSASYSIDFNIVGLMGTVVHAVAVYTGTRGELWVNGALQSFTAAFTYAPGSLETKLGTLYNGGATWSVDQTTHYGASGGNFVPTAAEISAASSSAASTGRPVGVPAKTDRRWSIPDDIADASGAVPTLLKERVTGANPLVMRGNGLLVSRRTERVWSFESSSGPAVMSGAQNWSAANYLARAGGSGQFLATAAPYWIALAVMVQSVPGASVELIFGGSTGSNPGLQIYLQVGAINATHALSPSGVAAPTAIAVTTTDVGKVLLFGFQWTGSALQTFARRAKVGSDVAAASFVPNPNGAFYLGRRFDTTSNPLGASTTVLGGMGGSGSLSLAEWQAAYDALTSDERLVAVPGKTQRLWNIGQGGALGVTADAMGSADALTVVGAPALSNIYSRAFAA